MDEEKFWQLVSESKKRCIDPDDPEEQGQILTTLLNSFSTSEVVSFKLIFRDQLQRAYRWDLWALPYIAYGGCSDDAFENFRAWLIGHGKCVFESAIKNPEILCDELLKLRSSYAPIAESEYILMAPSEAYKKKTGKDIYEVMPDKVIGEPSGEAWDDRTVFERFPKFSTRFSRR